MANAKLGWFNETRLHLGVKGIEIEGKKHWLSPVFDNRITKGVECPKCKKSKAFIFKSNSDERITVTACLGCREVSLDK